MHPAIVAWVHSGVLTGWLKSSGVGRSTLIPRRSSSRAKLSSSSLALATISAGTRPWVPRGKACSGKSLITDGSSAWTMPLSARPTITWVSRSHSFQAFTCMAIPVRLSVPRARRPGCGPAQAKPPQARSAAAAGTSARARRRWPHAARGWPRDGAATVFATSCGPLRDGMGLFMAVSADVIRLRGEQARQYWRDRLSRVDDPTRLGLRIPGAGPRPASLEQLPLAVSADGYRRLIQAGYDDPAARYPVVL